MNGTRILCTATWLLAVINMSLLLWNTSVSALGSDEEQLHACHAVLSHHVPLLFKYNAADEIFPGLWLGNECALWNASAYDVIITMSGEHARRPINGTRRYYFPLSDNSNNGDDGLIRAMLMDAATHISLFMHGHRVLVHCQMGISRSASAVIAFMLKYRYAATYHQALAHVKGVRDVVMPNRHFERILREIAHEMRIDDL